MRIIVTTALIIILHLALCSAQVQFICNELLGRPTNTSVTIHACANKDLDVYYEYGTDSLNYLNQTSVKSCIDSLPFVFVISNLNPDTKYYYRMRYRQGGTINFLTRTSHSFHTQRPSGSTFVFAIEADPHLDENSNPAVYALTLQNILLESPDFLIDLGDTFMSEKLQNPTQDSITIRHLLLRSYYDLICHSIPLYLVIGNHEGELGWLLDGTANNLPVMASNTRIKYYPNPVPDNFYSGNSTNEAFVGLRQNYYSWEWGSALFIVLDPFWYTKSKPDWGWTLGVDQYNWLKTVLSASKAKFKFVFCHQLIGGNGNDGRGGIEFAPFFEHGGRNADSTWGFDIYRTGWQKLIHTLMLENNVTIFFHGHDHFYGKQDKDGIVYQEVPQPSARSYTSNSAAQYGYVNGVIIPSRGYLLVNVTDTSTAIKYIRTYLPSEENTQIHNRDISHSYTIVKTASTTDVIDLNPVPNKFTLSQNYPNPFNPTTTIRYTVPQSSRVTITIYSTLGQEVARLVDGIKSPGTYAATWDAHTAGSGLYFCTLSTGSYRSTMKMMLIK
ncbi:MAG: T9SS type A sorting domain-containing protein [Bacteroidota bacterium]